MSALSSNKGKLPRLPMLFRYFLEKNETENK